METVGAERAATDEKTAAGAPRKRGRVSRKKLQENLWGWAFCLPLIVGTVWFVYIAFVMALMLSFTNYTLLRGSMLEYLGNFASNIVKDPNTGALSPFYWYRQAFVYEIGETYVMNELGAHLFNTVFYMAGIPVGIGLAMFFAVCMTRDIKGGNLFRVLYYLPCVASVVSVVFTFRILFDTNGAVNRILGIDLNWLQQTGNQAATWNSLTGSNAAGAFMNDPFWCQGFFQKLVIVIMAVWKGLGATILLYIAGLSGVNGATKEAAQIDGANGGQIFRKVVLPDLYPVIFYNVVTAVIGGMQIYTEPVLLFGESYMTSGFVSLIWRYGLSGNNPNNAKGAAYGMILAVIIFALTMFQFWLDSRNKD
ncbi:MAG: carbohydrate ABC transporter permease [Candidatus Gallimonas sp.]